MRFLASLGHWAIVASAAVVLSSCSSSVGTPQRPVEAEFTVDVKPTQGEVAKAQKAATEAAKSVAKQGYSLKETQEIADEVKRASDQAYLEGLGAGSVEATNLKIDIDKLVVRISDLVKENEKTQSLLRATEGFFREALNQISRLQNEVGKAEANYIAQSKIASENKGIADRSQDNFIKASKGLSAEQALKKLWKKTAIISMSILLLLTTINVVYMTRGGILL